MPYRIRDGGGAPARTSTLRGRGREIYDRLICQRTRRITVYEGLRFLEEIGVPEVQRHGTALVARLLDQIDVERWRVLTPEPERSPILCLRPPTTEGLRDRLVRANVTVSTGGDMDRLMRVSPAIYNTEEDVDRLAEVINDMG